MAHGKFDADAFFSAVEAVKEARRLSWKKVAEEAKVPASTLTRMSQGKRPDVDTLAALCGWSGLDVHTFIRDEGEQRRSVEPLAQVTAYLRGDANLSPESSKALETLLKTAYENLRKK